MTETKHAKSVRSPTRHVLNVARNALWWVCHLLFLLFSATNVKLFATPLKLTETHTQKKRQDEWQNVFWNAFITSSSYIHNLCCGLCFESLVEFCKSCNSCSHWVSECLYDATGFTYAIAQLELRWRGVEQYCLWIYDRKEEVSSSFSLIYTYSMYIWVCLKHKIPFGFGLV